MKKLFVALAIILIIVDVAAVTVSVTTTNSGSTVSVSHNYSANSDGSYKTNGNGEITYGSVEVDSKASYSAKGEFYTETKVNKGDWYGRSFLELEQGNAEGSIQAKVDNNVYVSQSFDVSAEDTYDFKARTHVRKDANLNNLVDDMRAEAYAEDNNTGTMQVEQSASSGSAKATQHFLQRRGTESGGYIRVSASKNFDKNNKSAEEYARAYVKFINNVEVWQKAEVDSNVGAEQNVLVMGDGDSPHISAFAYTDSDTDGIREEFARNWVEWKRLQNPVYGSIYQSASTGSVKTGMEGSLKGGISMIWVRIWTDKDDDETEDHYAYVKVFKLMNDTVKFKGYGYYKDDKAYAKLHADIKNPDGDKWKWYEEAYKDEKATSKDARGSFTGDKVIDLWADSSIPDVNDNP